MSALHAAGQGPLVEVAGLSVRFPGEVNPAVRDIGFAIHRGECLALVGESGSGKSVTARTLVGLTGRGAYIAAQRLQFNGQSLRDLSASQWRSIRGAQIGFVMQDALGSLDPLRSMGREVEESLELHTLLKPAQRSARVIELLRCVGVPEPEVRARQYPHQLSGGLRQRALIASAIACAPALLIADEPTTALDALVQSQVLELLLSLRSPDRAMLLVSHDLSVVGRLADRIAVMQHGAIVELGSARQILEDPQHPYTQSLLRAAISVHSRPIAVTPRAPSPVRPSPAAQSDWVIQAEHLYKSFKGPRGERRAAVSDVSFHLRPGETLGIVGESGSGKTTTKRLVLGLLAPDSGTVKLHGQDWASLSGAAQRALRKRIQVVFQDPLSSFDPRYTVARVINEALAVAGQVTPAAQRARALELMDWVRLDPSVLARRPIELSGGQRQRVAIARALAAEPDVLLCDEPVSALDVSVQAQILDLLSDLKARLRIACLFISHDLGIVYRVSDRVLVMKDGVAVEQGDVQQIFNAPKHEYTRQLLKSIPQLPDVEAQVHCA